MCYALCAIVVSSRENRYRNLPGYASSSQSGAPEYRYEAYLSTALEHGVLVAKGGVELAITLNGSARAGG